MDRRKFFGLLGAGVAGVALSEAIPLGRVWSFPSKIVVRTGWIGFDPALRKSDITVVRMGNVIRLVLPQNWIVRDFFQYPTLRRYEGYELIEHTELSFRLEPLQKNVLDL